MIPVRASALEVDRERPLSDTRVVSDTLDEPSSGQVVLDVEAFGLSSNNVTYALLGDLLGHWRPFPAEDGWGRVPAWGVARVTGGDSSLAPIGARLVGYLPMATRFLLDGVATPSGVEVTSAERAGILPMYRHMRRVDTDPTWDDAHLGVELQLLPVTPPAALLSRDLLTSAPSQVVISSASSKTALALGRLLRLAHTRTVGLTGATRSAAVAATEAFDDVVPYDRLDTVRRVDGTIYVDISGDAALTRAVHDHLGSTSTGSVAVGGSHLARGGAVPTTAEVPGPTPARFSVGRREVELVADLGAPAVERALADARGVLVNWALTWMGLETTDGLGPAQETWRRVAHGDLPGLVAAVVRP